MKLGRWSIGILVTLAVLGGGGYLAYQKYFYYLPRIIADIRDPIQPYHEVVWSQGPAAAPAAPTQNQPNIILIVADDLGYNDISFGGGGVANGAVPTPNIDSIAKDGANFSQSYAGNATCSPSRAAMMTGRFATRFGFEFTPAGPGFARVLSHSAVDGPKLIYHPELEKDMPSREASAVPLSEIMLPEILKSKGYHTAGLGKWHLGETDATRPEARGFDEYLGFLYGASMFLPEGDPNVVNSKQDFDQIDKFLWANLPFAVVHNRGKRFAPNKYMTDYLAEEAAKAVTANKNRPFFLYVGFNAPHTPLQALKSDYDALSGISDHRLRVYAAMIKALDRGVGSVLDAVKANGLDDNTIIIFTSDNGGAGYIGLPEINKPFRGWKSTFFEGGIRVPMFVRWQNHIMPGTDVKGAVGHVDIFATAAAAAGASMPTDRVVDGVNLMPVANGSAPPNLNRSLFWRSGQYKVLLDGGWKLQVAALPDKKWLFNLKDDPTEQKNLADADPARVAEMSAALAKIDSEQVKPLWPSLLEGAIFIDKTLGVPREPNDEYVYWAN